MGKIERRREGKTSTTRTKIMPGALKVKVKISTKVMPEETFQFLFQAQSCEV